MPFYTLSDFDLQNLSPEDLGEILISAKKAYYTTGKPIMDDHTYDTLEDILRQKNPNHRIFNKIGNPNFDTGFEKKEHHMPMGSLNKVTKFEDLQKYFNLKKIAKNTDFIVQPKCDGISLEISYQKGKLVEAITRGDGAIGDVVTQNVVKMNNFVHNTGTFTGSVRCEIVMLLQDFKKLNNIINKNVLPPLSKGGGEAGGILYSNPRNAVSGLTQRLDSKYTEFCSLIAVDIHPGPITEIEKISLLKQIGFTPVETTLCHSYQEIENIYQQFFLHQRQSYPFEIDGLVIKINDLRIQQELGVLNHRPKGQVAYKFPAASNSSQIIAIDWQVGPLGTITPVAQIEPVEISGAIITYASLANIDLIEEKGINVGDIVEVSRRGDVIPHIESVVTKVTPGFAPAPLFCPQCQSPTIKDHKFLKCPNPECPAQSLGLLRLFCQVVDIKGISDKTIAKLVAAQKIEKPGDFYRLAVSDFANLDGLGDKSGTNIVNQIKSKKTLDLVTIFQSAAIPNFSAARIKQLIKAGFNSPQKLLNITIEQLEALPGIQITLANKIFSGLQLRKTNIQSILDQVTLKQTTAQSAALSGLTFCITGELSQSRSKVAALIESAGGTIQNAVSSHTSYLVTNELDSSSSKFLSARKLNIPIINEDKLYQLINNSL